ncbi:MAG: N-acetylmuramoyl-L-alanine amidase [Gemmatimonadota bacterium]
MLLVVLAVVCLRATSLHAQDPLLRIDGAVSAAIDGARVGEAAAFPAQSLELLGFDVTSDATGLTAVLGADTIRFWTTSPFFVAGSTLHQLALAVGRADGDAQIPEQFFIRWLPSAYPELFAYRGGSLLVSRAPAIVAARAPASVTDPAVAARTAARREAARTRTVVIDAGHGGRDPGKIAPGGLREKDVTLTISKRLASALRARGYEVFLTRTTDTLIALGDRPRMANEWRGERPVAVFLSIHANAFRLSSATGFETFILSEARTEDERRVAEMENESVRFEDTPVAPAAGGLDQILTSLRSDFLIRASHDLATAVQDNIASFHPGPNRGVKRGGLIVLIGAIMPAVLIEVGFLSNPAEARLLGTPTFHQQVTDGIADAVDQFFARNEHLWVQDP